MHLIYSIVKVQNHRGADRPTAGWLYDCGR